MTIAAFGPLILHLVSFSRFPQSCPGIALALITFLADRFEIKRHCYDITGYRKLQ
jgi:hypothetical protein